MTALQNRYCVLLLLFVTLGIYYPVIFAPFSSIDDIKMVNWLINANHLSIKSLFLPGGSGYYYRPLVGLSFWMDKILWGLQESFMHLENIVLHAANAVLVFSVALRIFQRLGFRDNLFPLCSALFFALHPINTEAVNWISGRTDLLSGLFILVSLLTLFNSLESNSKFWGVLSASLFFVSCLAKETAIFFYPAALFTVFCYDARDMSLRVKVGRRASLYVFFTTAALFYFYLRHLAFARGDSGISHAAESFVAGNEAGYLYTLKLIVKVAGFYAKKLFFPWPLNFGIIHVSDNYIPFGILLIMTALFMLWKRDTVATLFMTSFCVGASSLLVAVSRMAWTPLAERYMYIPSTTFAVAIVLVLATSARKRNLGSLAAPVLMLGCMGIAFSTTARNIVWQDNLTLFADTVRKSPDFAPARNDLAVAMLGHGRVEEAHHLIMSNAADASVNNYQIAYLNKAGVLAAEKDLEGARIMLLELLRDPGKQELEIVRNLIAINEKRIVKTRSERTMVSIRSETIDLLNKENKLTGDPFCLYRIGQEFLAMKKKGEAQSYFERAFRKAPDGAYYKEPARKLAERLQ
jgi:protein O-mannosyl-transferase